MKSFNQLNFMIKAGEFNEIYSRTGQVPQIDAIRSSLKSVKLDALRQINQRIIKMAVRNKVLGEGNIDGYTVAAIDGTNLFNIRKPSCDDCIYTNRRGKVYYAHACTVMSLISDGANLVIDYEMVKHRKEANDTGEGELISVRRLLNRAVSTHKGLIDVVTYDALASNLFQLFTTRRLKNHVPIQMELIRLLHRGLYQADRKSISFLNTA